MTKSVPSHWECVEFGDVATVVGGGTPPSTDANNFTTSDGIPWLTPADLSRDREQYIQRGARNLTEQGYAACSAKKMPAGTVLFSSRAPIGYVAIAANEVATNQGFKSFVLPAGMESRYVYYYLRHIKPLAEQRATGTTFKELSGSAAAQLPLLVAPEGEQKRIADKLDTVLARADACRDRLNLIGPLLKRFRQSVLAAATSGRLTEDWRIESGASNWLPTVLSELCVRDRVITYGVIKLGDEVENGVPCLRTSNVRWLHIDTDGMKRIAPSLSDEYSRTVLRGGEILVNVRGTLGGVAIARPEMRGWNVSREVAVVPIDERKVTSAYMALWIAAGDSQRWLAKVEKGVAYVGINIEDLRNLPVEVPSPQEQNEITRRVDQLFAFADRLEKRLARALVAVDRLTPALLAKAFRGELAPQDPTDEPAAELLKRLRDDRVPVANGTKARRSKRTSSASRESDYENAAV